jgi:KTSC domain-containing protein
MPSSVIRAALYDPDRRVLDIVFTTGRRYLYHDVPPEAADAFRAAFSKGRHFNAHVRDRYECTEVPA